MTKQNSSKKQPKHSLEGPAIQQQKLSFKPKKIGTEIDEIFARKKRKRPEKDKKGNSEKPVKVSAANVNDKMRIVKNGKSKSLKENGPSDPTSQPRKRTAGGLAIYTQEELGFGKPEAGGTPLCPFDCDCCF